MTAPPLSPDRPAAVRGRREKVFTALLILFVTLAVFGAGFLAGRYQALYRLKKVVSKYDRGVTFGRLLPPERLKEISVAFYDPAAFLQNHRSIIWSVFNVLTPFVLSAPEPGHHKNAIINARQFRDAREVALPKPPGTFRIFFTGGSTAFGSGAPTQDTTIAAYLERLLNEKVRPRTGRTYEVVTAANPAWTSTHERVFIENRLSELEPDLVIAFSGNNDAHWSWYGEDILWLWTYYDSFLITVINEAFRLAGKAAMPDVTVKGPVPVPAAQVAARLEKNLRLSHHALSLKQARYLYCLQPTLAVTKKPLSPREKRIWSKDGKNEIYFQECYAAMAQKAGGLNLPGYAYLSLVDVFDNLQEKDEIFTDHYHFGDRGNDLIARTLAARLPEEMLK
jgi:hypothetical protein